MENNDYDLELNNIKKLDVARDNIFSDLANINDKIREINKNARKKEKINKYTYMSEFMLMLIGLIVPKSINIILLIMIISYSATKYYEVKKYGNTKKNEKEKQRLILQQQILLTDYEELENTYKKLQKNIKHEDIVEPNITETNIEEKNHTLRLKKD